MAASFGVSPMGAVWLNGAAGRAKDPVERLRLSSRGWALWAPVSAGAIAVHAIGGAGLILANRKRVSQDEGTNANLDQGGGHRRGRGPDHYAGALGAKVTAHSDADAEGSVTPGEPTPADVASAQKQLKIVQFAIPALACIAIVMGAPAQRAAAPRPQLIGRLTTVLPST